MNLSSQTAKSMTMSSSSASWKSEGVVDQFPAGLRVLVVDDDPTCLMILEKMLRNCRYEVTKCNQAEIALSLLRENRHGFDIVISDVHMPDMDGFKLLEHVGLEMDLPVIMMSADDSKSVVMKGVTHGACDYLIKPVRIEALKNIWQHVVRKRKHEWKEIEQSGSLDDGDRHPKQSEDADYSSTSNEGNVRNSKRRKDEEDDADDRDDSSTLKKPRVVWSVELHQQFVAAVNQLGIDTPSMELEWHRPSPLHQIKGRSTEAVPKKILELMNVPGLTRENVASHLQKYRLYLRRLSGVSQHPNGLNNSFMGPPAAPFGPISSLNGLDLQALAAAGQLPGQSLATLQAAALGRSNPKSGGITMAHLDQRNLFSFESPKLRFGEGGQQQQHQHQHQHQQMNNNNSKQINLLHGIPTNMEPNQLVNLHQSAQSFRGMNMQVNRSQSNSLLVHMAQPPTRLHMNETNGNQTNARNGMIDNVGGTVYNSVSQSSSVADFSQNNDLSGSSFPLVNDSGMSSLASKGLLQEEVNSELKRRSHGYLPSYDIFNELHQQPKSQEWELQNIGLAFDGSQQRGANIQGSMDIPPSVMIQQSFPSGQKSGQNRNTSIGNKAMFSGVGEGSGHHLNNAFMVDNSQRVKAERLPDPTCQNTLFPEHFGQEDLMSALFKQQEGIGAVENEYGFDGYPLDNLPV